MLVGFSSDLCQVQLIVSHPCSSSWWRMFEHVTVVDHLIPWKVAVLYMHADTLSSQPQIETPPRGGGEEAY